MKECKNGKVSSISIHAPTKGATLMNNVTVTGKIFQSTHPRRVRQRKYKTSTHHITKRKSAMFIFASTTLRKNLNFTAFLFLQKNVYLNLATYNKSNPSASYDGFAPICSVLLLYLFPRL